MVQSSSQRQTGQMIARLPVPPVIGNHAPSGRNPGHIAVGPPAHNALHGKKQHCELYLVGNSHAKPQAPLTQSSSSSLLLLPCPALPRYSSNHHLPQDIGLRILTKQEAICTTYT